MKAAASACETDPVDEMSLLMTASSPTLDRPATIPASTIRSIIVLAPWSRNWRNRSIFSMPSSP